MTLPFVAEQPNIVFFRDKVFCFGRKSCFFNLNNSNSEQLPSFDQLINEDIHKCIYCNYINEDMNGQVGAFYFIFTNGIKLIYNIYTNKWTKKFININFEFGTNLHCSRTLQLLYWVRYLSDGKPILNKYNIKHDVKYKNDIIHSFINMQS